MRIQVFLICSIISSFSFSQGEENPLIKGAHEMIISEETNFTILDINQSSLSKKYLACILDRYASNKNNLLLHYDDFSKIKDARVIVYDKNLNEIKSYKLKDFQDYSASGSNMASDSRVKVLRVNERNFPYFIEVEYTIDFVGSLHYPKWAAQEDEKISVVTSKLIVESFLNKSFRFQSNIPMTDSIAEPNHFKYTWQVDSLSPFNWQRFSYETSDYSPVVWLAPSRFQMNDIEGDLSTWSSFGEWIDILNKDQNTLTELEKGQIRDLVLPDDTRLVKTKKIYQYLQANTRYVSIQLGIGGWKPFETGMVHNDKFGDCKALSFYTLSMLKEVGVDAYYTLIRAGRTASRIPPDFPNAHFNHAILTVPLESDTIWLECTSQTNPFGYLGTFTSDRDALLIDGKNSKIIYTRTYNTEENLQSTLLDLTISKEGVGAGEYKRIYSGIEIENDGFVHVLDNMEREKNEWFVDNHEWGDLSVSGLAFSDIQGSIVPEASVTATIELRNAAITMGNRLFFNPFKFTNIEEIKLPDNERSIPLEIRYTFSQRDSIKVHFDEVFYPEKTINNSEIKSSFGSYSVEVIKNENDYIFIRNFSLTNGVYDSADYADFKGFIESVKKSDRQRLVLINKT
ncbi:MAG: DUF3857 domain-containing protein [Bacteroidota bacterium]